MGITSSNKVVDRSEVGCDGEFQVTLALTAAPDIIENPTDIVLVLDRSGSMSGVPLAAMKEGSNTLLTSYSRPPMTAAAAGTWAPVPVWVW